jgi:hypothetical protein
MAPRRVKRKVYVGPQGGRYVIRNGRKVYLTGGGRMQRRPRARGMHQRYVRGRGGFKEFAGNALRGIGAIAGGAIGGFTGGPWGAIKGAATGSGLAGLASSLVGLGDYEGFPMPPWAKGLHQNSLLGLDVGGIGSGAAAQIINSGTGPTIVRHTEYLGDVFSSDEFLNAAYKINPGDQSTFPWLYKIARNYTQWEPRGIIFNFKSTSADALNSTNTALGTVIYATDYNAVAPPFSTKQEMENTEYYCATKPACSMRHPIECSPRENPQKIFYVRTGGALPDDADPRLYDLGVFQIGTVGSQAAANVGELSVTYEIAFYKPRYDTSGVPSAAYLAVGADTTINNSNPMGSVQTSSFDNIGVSFTNSFIQLDDLPKNTKYLVAYVIDGTGTSSTRVQITQQSGDIALMDLYSSVTTLPNQAATQSPVSSGLAIAETGPLGGPCFLGITLSAPATPTYAVFYMTQINWHLGPLGASLLSSRSAVRQKLTHPLLELPDELSKLIAFAGADEAKSMIVDDIQKKNAKLSRLEAYQALMGAMDESKRHDGPIVIEQSDLPVSARAVVSSLSTSQLMEAAVKKAAEKSHIRVVQ